MPIVDRRLLFAGNAVIVLILLLAAFFAGYRTLGAGRDYLQYAFFFTDIRIDDALSYFRFGPGFTLTAYISKFVLRLDYQLFAVLLLFATLLLKARVFWNRQNVLLVLLFYFLAWYPLHEYTQVRLAVAIALLFLAMNALFETRFVVAAAFLVGAVSFQYSGLIVAPFAVVAYMLSGRPVWVGILAMTGVAAIIRVLILAYASIIYGFNPLVEGYLVDGLGTEVNVFSVANIWMAFALLSVWATGGLREPKTKALFLIVFASFPLFILFLDTPIFAHRLKELLMCFSVLLLFERKITWWALPQMFFGFLFAATVVYTAIRDGIIGGSV